MDKGDWVKFKNGKTGIVEQVLLDGKLRVMLPSTTDWAFPQWETVLPIEVKKTHRPRTKQLELSLDNIDVALL